MFRKFAFAAVLTTIALPAMADTPRLDGREQNQRQRIEQGIGSGELTRPEAKRLVRGEVRLHRHERLAKSDGVVTRAERLRLQKNANRMSKRIYVQKHDAQSRPRSW